MNELTIQPTDTLSVLFRQEIAFLASRSDDEPHLVRLYKQYASGSHSQLVPPFLIWALGRAQTLHEYRDTLCCGSRKAKYAAIGEYFALTGAELERAMRILPNGRSFAQPRFEAGVSELMHFSKAYVANDIDVVTAVLASSRLGAFLVPAHKICTASKMLDCGEQLRSYVGSEIGQIEFVAKAVQDRVKTFGSDSGALLCNNLGRAMTLLLDDWECRKPAEYAQVVLTTWELLRKKYLPHAALVL